MGLNISQTGDSIVVRLDPLDALFAIKRRLDIPRSHVESIEVVERADVPTPVAPGYGRPGPTCPASPATAHTACGSRSRWWQSREA